jgi:hypothetical protein
MDEFLAAYPSEDEFPYTDFGEDEQLVCFRSANFTKIFSMLLESKESKYPLAPFCDCRCLTDGLL